PGEPQPTGHRGVADLDPAAGFRPDAGVRDPAMLSVGWAEEPLRRSGCSDGAEGCADYTPRPSRLRVFVLSAAQSAFRRREPDPTDAGAGYRRGHDALSYQSCLVARA